MPRIKCYFLTWSTTNATALHEHNSFHFDFVIEKQNLFEKWLKEWVEKVKTKANNLQVQGE